jgi:hypothetical protein
MQPRHLEIILVHRQPLADLGPFSETRNLLASHAFGGRGGWLKNLQD